MQSLIKTFYIFLHSIRMSGFDVWLKKEGYGRKTHLKILIGFNANDDMRNSNDRVR